MRLINANLLSEAIWDNVSAIYEDARCAKEDCLAEIEAAPTVDAVPVVHGRWDGDTCTACKLPWKYNMVQDADDWGYFDPMPDYCPNCGAKMDLEAL